MVSINTTTYAGADLITVSGRIDSSNASEVDDALKNLYEKGRQKLAVDLSGIEYMSSAGLRVLVSAQRSCSGGVVLVSPSAKVEEVLSLAGLNSVFTVYDDQTAAIGSFT